MIKHKVTNYIMITSLFYTVVIVKYTIMIKHKVTNYDMINELLYRMATVNIQS